MTVVVDYPCAVLCCLLLKTNLVACGPKADAVVDDVGRANPGFEGDASGEDDLSGLWGWLAVPGPVFGGAAEHKVVSVGVDGDQVG